MKAKHPQQELRPAHKRGDDVNEMAVRPRKVSHNFKTSKDVREDRGRRQTKLANPT